MFSDNEMISKLVALLAEKGVQHAVISPGSRNAPLINSLTSHPDIVCHSITDERSAGYFALGLSLSLNEPVALTCTSGTATLNYAPAIAEAYYQRVPLIALTADRPEELIDQREGQAIRQKKIYHNFINFEAALPQEPYDEDRLWYGERLIAEAINQAITPARGPVHLNIPLREPLYGKQEKLLPAGKNIRMHQVATTLPENVVLKLASLWNSTEKVMILTGVLSGNHHLQNLIKKAAQLPNTIVLTERTSNLYDEEFHHHIDRLLNTIPPNHSEEYAPDLLITIGTDVVSKQIKAFLRKHRPENHWHIDEGKQHTDTYKSLTDVIPTSPDIFMENILPHLYPEKETSFSKKWGDLEDCAEKVHNDFMADAEWSDLLAFKILMAEIPAPSVLHLGNSTPVRYSLLFPPQKNIRYLSNRGTSGIDGIVSTAAGFATGSNEINTVITGDVSFFYDSNAMWNTNLPSNLRIIVIHNQGGSIFRIIPGPSGTGQMEKFFETRQTFNIEKMAAVFDLKYYYCDEQTELEDVLKEIYKPHEQAVILEIKTPGEKNDKVLKAYFNRLKTE
ncbi:MAG: 2-succinyl-5-enolpyruvyl-6-hydroxy-3-cyclohexene-1-carboxylic-acid synthase [Bacteroidota bacterium]